jgi:hypothetical protein
MRRERDEARAALRFDVDSNSATGWMVKYQRQLDANEVQKKNIEHLLACEAVYRKERDELRVKLSRAEAELARLHNIVEEEIGWQEQGGSETHDSLKKQLIAMTERAERAEADVERLSNMIRDNDHHTMNIKAGFAEECEKFQKETLRNSDLHQQLTKERARAQKLVELIGHATALIEEQDLEDRTVTENEVLYHLLRTLDAYEKGEE